MASNTRTRILDTSVNLFNAQGVAGTSANDIAFSLGISPGNLTYHFPRKRDIVIAVEERFLGSLEELQNNLIESIAIGKSSVSPAETIKLLRQLIGIIWTNRFYAVSYSGIAELDEDIVARFALLEQRVRFGLAELVQKALDAGVIVAMRHPNSPSRLADNIWYLIWGRILFHLLNEAPSVPKAERVCQEVIACILALVMPHVEQSFAAKLEDEAVR